MSEDLILVERDERNIVTLILNRPDKRNALSIPMGQALCNALDAANADESVRAIVLRGNGPAFCAGLDLAEATDTVNSHKSAGLVADMLDRIYYSTKPTIAAVHGAAIAGGAGLMTACDLAIATADTKIGYPEVRRGMVAGLVMTFLRRQLHERHARELLLLGEIITAERAEAMGLVNKCVPTDMLDEALELYIEQILQGAPGAISRTKAFYKELWPRTVKEDLQRALALHVEVRNAGEAQEGMLAFLEKREPQWRA